MFTPGNMAETTKPSFYNLETHPAAFRKMPPAKGLVNW
jgi:hypothetical protein